MNSVVARRRLFSTAHLYKQDAFSDEKNREVFGACYSAHGHGHNYILEIFVEGAIDSANGLVVNVNELDAIMKTACAPFDHLHISFDVPAFKGIIPTTEHLASYLFTHVKSELKRVLPKLSLQRIRLFETDDLWTVARASSNGSIAPAPSRKPKSFDVTREFVIRAIHHLENPAWSPEENKSFYGICYGIHGHDYRVQVTCRASMDDRTGISVDRDALDQILEREIRLKYDGVDLNKRFKNTSCEQLATEFYQLLQPKFTKGSLVKVGIQETRKNYFEFPPDLGVGDAGTAGV